MEFNEQICRKCIAEKHGKYFHSIENLSVVDKENLEGTQMSLKIELLLKAPSHSLKFKALEYCAGDDCPYALEQTVLSDEKI